MLMGLKSTIYTVFMVSSCTANMTDANTIVILFIYHSFNNTVNRSDYIALNYMITSK